MIADDDVYEFGEVSGGGIGHDEMHAIGEAVRTCQLPRELDDSCLLYTVDAGRAGAAREQTKNPCARRNVEDDIAWADDGTNRARQCVDAVLVANELAMFVELDGHLTTSSDAIAARSETHLHHSTSTAVADRT